MSEPKLKTTELAVWKPDAAIKKLVKGAAGKLALAQAHSVDSLETYDYADKDLEVIATELKQLEAVEVLSMKEVKDIVKERTAFFAKAKKALKSAKELLRAKLASYNRRQEAVARAAQEAADREVERLAKEARDKAIKETEGLGEEARDAALQVAESQKMPSPVITAATPAGNTTYRDHWVTELDENDPNAWLVLLRHLINNQGDPDLQEYVVLNTSKLNKIAGSIQKERGLVPGLVIINKRIAVT